MRKYNNSLMALPLALMASSLGSCLSSEDEPTNLQDAVLLEVAAEYGTGYDLFDNNAENPFPCLLVKESGCDGWKQIGQEAIAGFDYKEGKRYVLKVEKRTLPNPPADASNIGYSLQNVVNSQPVADFSVAANSSEDNIKFNYVSEKPGTVPKSFNVMVNSIGGDLTLRCTNFKSINVKPGNAPSIIKDAKVVVKRIDGQTINLHFEDVSEKQNWLTQDIKTDSEVLIVSVDGQPYENTTISIHRVYNSLPVEYFSGYMKM